MRWSVFIDVEGFSKIYEEKEGRAYHSVGSLINYIYEIGTKIYNDEYNSLFVHQMGDGFVIVSLNDPQDIDNAIIIAISLMRLMLINGHMTKSAISIGDFADIVGCYPKQIQKEYQANETIRIGHGVLRIFPVMGGALINSYKLLSKSNSGPNLSLDIRLKEYVKLTGLKYGEEYNNLIEIDWINSDIEKLVNIGRVLNYEEIFNKAFLKIRFQNYLEENNLPESWVENAKNLLIQ